MILLCGFVSPTKLFISAAEKKVFLDEFCDSGFSCWRSVSSHLKSVILTNTQATCYLYWRNTKSIWQINSCLFSGEQLRTLCLHCLSLYKGLPALLLSSNLIQSEGPLSLWDFSLFTNCKSHFCGEEPTWSPQLKSPPRERNFHVHRP